jgi:hypothetical protein
MKGDIFLFMDNGHTLFNTASPPPLQIPLCPRMLGSNPGLLRLWLKRSNSSARSHPHNFHNELMFPYLIKIRKYMIYGCRRTATEKTTREYRPQTNPKTLVHQDEAASLKEETIAAEPT